MSAQLTRRPFDEDEVEEDEEEKEEGEEENVPGGVGEGEGEAGVEGGTVRGRVEINFCNPVLLIPLVNVLRWCRKEDTARCLSLCVADSLNVDGVDEEEDDDDDDDEEGEKVEDIPSAATPGALCMLANLKSSTLASWK